MKRPSQGSAASPCLSDKIQSQDKCQSHSVQGAQSIMHTEGLAGFYHGLLPTLLRDVPEIALQFYLYERLRQVPLQRSWSIPPHMSHCMRAWQHAAVHAPHVPWRQRMHTCCRAPTSGGSLRDTH